MTSLYIGNLPYAVDGGALQKVFAGQGFAVEEARIVLDRETGRPRGFGFVDVDDAHVQTVIQAMDGFPLGGRTLRVSIAARKTPTNGRARPGRPAHDDVHDERSKRRPRRGDAW